jgi:membrane protein required for colicin V production
MAATFSWVDWVLLAVLGLSIVVGLWRGLMFEVLSLLGWLAAYIAAQWFAPLAAPYVPVGAAGSGLNQGAAFAAVFIGALVVWGLSARLVRLLVHATPLNVVDRALGAGFGLLRGGVLLLAVATVVTLTPAARSPAWQHSHGAVWLQTLLHGLKPVLPADLARHLPGHKAF